MKALKTLRFELRLLLERAIIELAIADLRRISGVSPSIKLIAWTLRAGNVSCAIGLLEEFQRRRPLIDVWSWPVRQLRRLV